MERTAAGRHADYAAAEARTGASDCAALRATTRSHRTEAPLHGGATARRRHRTESLGGARAQWGEARTV